MSLKIRFFLKLAFLLCVGGFKYRSVSGEHNLVHCHGHRLMMELLVGISMLAVKARHAIPYDNMLLTVITIIGRKTIHRMLFWEEYE